MAGITDKTILAKLFPDSNGRLIINNHHRGSAMVPVLPFSVFFAAIGSAQLDECYVHTRSMGELWVCGVPGPVKPPELSIKHLYPPDMELKADIIGLDRKEVHKPRMPPYTVRTHPIIPQACAPDKDGVRPDRLPSGRCDVAACMLRRSANSVFLLRSCCVNSFGAVGEHWER